MENLKDLYQFASVRQIEYLEAIEKYGSMRKAAKKLNIAHQTINKAIDALKRKAATMGYSPEHDMTKTVPDGFFVKGVSTYYNKDGRPLGQWVKSSIDQDRQEELLKEFAQTLADGVKGLAPISIKPKISEDDLLCIYPIGDPHFGMMAWAQETGENFDLKIAESLTCGAIDRLIQSAPPSKTAILLNLGDHFHADTQHNTTTSGTPVDVDGLWSKIQQVGLRAMLYCINQLLKKHEKVIFKINRGNHDKHASYALALMISCYYHNEPRVEVDLSPGAAWYFRFGNVLIGSTHGDTMKGKDLVGVMAADQPENWGKTKHRYWYVGHVHHIDVKEYPGGIVEYFRTLASSDAWHKGQGYRAGRDMRLIVLHKEHGEIERHRVDSGMLKA